MLFSILETPISSVFVPHNCSNTSTIGIDCDIPNTPCHSQKPCMNSGNCTNDPKHSSGYYCTCQPGFTGHDCGNKTGPCKTTTCLHDGAYLFL